MIRGFGGPKPPFHSSLNSVRCLGATSLEVAENQALVRLEL